MRSGHRGHAHGFGHGRPRGRHAHRAPLHVRLFWWAGLSIFVMGAAAGVVVWLFGPAHSWDDEALRVRTFASDRFSLVWRDERGRNELASAVAKTFDVGVELRDLGGRRLFRTGPPCERGNIAVSIRDHGEVLGEAALCAPRRFGPPRHVFWLALATSGVTLWFASLLLARRLGRPLRALARVASDIGEGKLDSRAHVGRRHPWEITVLSEAVNDMAERIERQLVNQRELVAAVSHEIRAPLTRLRMEVEMLRGLGADAKSLAKLEREIVEIDSLVGDLLASSRLDFSMLSFRALDAREVSLEALDRAGQSPEKLDVRAKSPLFEGDLTLISRALANLLDNAARHGGGATALVVRDTEPDGVVFEVHDQGPGFAAEMLPRAFEPFQRGHVERRGSTSLGLGLALVRRIAEAHGGAAWAENRTEGGAKVAMRVQRKNSSGR